jgi:hypothetical protein
MAKYAVLPVHTGIRVVRAEGGVAERMLADLIRIYCADKSADAFKIHIEIYIEDLLSETVIEIALVLKNKRVLYTCAMTAKTLPVFTGVRELTLANSELAKPGSVFTADQMSDFFVGPVVRTWAFAGHLRIVRRSKIPQNIANVAPFLTALTIEYGARTKSKHLPRLPPGLRSLEISDSSSMQHIHLQVEPLNELTQLVVADMPSMFIPQSWPVLPKISRIYIECDSIHADSVPSLIRRAVSVGLFAVRDVCLDAPDILPQRFELFETWHPFSRRLLRSADSIVMAPFPDLGHDRSVTLPTWLGTVCDNVVITSHNAGRRIVLYFDTVLPAAITYQNASASQWMQPAIDLLRHLQESDPRVRVRLFALRAMRAGIVMPTEVVHLIWQTYFEREWNAKFPSFRPNIQISRRPSYDMNTAWRTFK